LLSCDFLGNLTLQKVFYKRTFLLSIIIFKFPPYTISLLNNLFLYNNIHSVIILAILSLLIILSATGTKDSSLFSTKSDSMDYPQESANRITPRKSQRHPPQSNQSRRVPY